MMWKCRKCHLRETKNLQNFMVSWGTIPPESRALDACALGTCVSTFMVPKNTPYFPSKGVGISVQVIGHVKLKNIPIITKNILTAHPSLADHS